MAQSKFSSTLAFTISKEDQAFLRQVESGNFSIDDFNHRAHLRLAYIYLTNNDSTDSVTLVRNTLTALLEKHNIEPEAIYHETLTHAWVQLVERAMKNSPPVSAAESFIESNPQLFDKDILNNHYSETVLKSDAAKTSYIAPDLQPIASQPSF